MFTNIRKLLIFLLVTATLIEEKPCAVTIDVVARNVTGIVEKHDPNKNKAKSIPNSFPVILDYEPLAKQVRRNTDQTSASYETQNLAEVLENIEYDAELLREPSLEESDEENKSNFENFQDLIKINTTDDRREKQRQYEQSLNRQIAGREILQPLFKNIPKKIYYNSNEQHPKYGDYIQNIQQQNKDKSSVYNNFFQQYRNFFTDRNDEDEIHSIVFHDDKRNRLEDVNEPKKTRSRIKPYYIPRVPKSGTGKKFEEAAADDDEDDKFISLEQEYKYLGNKHRHRRSTTKHINQLPHPEHTEGSHITKDNDVYYDQPRNWPYPKDGQFDIDDPRNPKHPLYGQWWRAKFVPQKFIVDDYQPFLGIDFNPYEHPSVLHGQQIFLSQAVPLLKSIIYGTGIEQGPKDSPFRVHWTDLKHYKETAVPPPPGPMSRRMNSIYIKEPTQIDDGEYIDQSKNKIDLQAFQSEVNRVLEFKKSNSKAEWKTENKNNNNEVNEQKKQVPKKLVWWPRKGKSKPEKKLFDFDKNKNYTVILNIT